MRLSLWWIKVRCGAGRYVYGVIIVEIVLFELDRYSSHLYGFNIVKNLTPLNPNLFYIFYTCLRSAPVRIYIQDLQ